MTLANLNAQSLLNALPAGVVVHGPDTRVLYANPMALKTLRLTREQIDGKSAMDSHWKFVDRFKSPLPLDAYPVNLVLARKAAVSDCVVGVMDGSSTDVTWVMVNAYPELNVEGNIEQVIVSFVDITQTHDDIPFDAIVELASDIIVITKADPHAPEIVYVNQAFTRLTGYTFAEAIGQTPRFLQRTETDAATRARIREALSNGQTIHETILNFHKNGDRYWLDMHIVPLFNQRNELVYFAAIERDVTSLKEKELNLVALAEHDPLTGLLNRRGFTDICDKRFANSTTAPVASVVAMMDIDFFKKINDTHGHDVGDLALQHFAGLIRSGFRANDVAARIGGEEFVVLLSGVDAAEGCRILNQFREKVANAALSMKDGTVLHLAVSIGLTSRQPGDDTDMLKRADLAMYEAKRTGRNRVVAL